MVPACSPVSGPLYRQLLLRRDLTAAIIDILFDAQRQVLRRLHHAFGVVQPVSRQLCFLLALNTTLRIVKTVAYGPPAPWLPIQPLRVGDGLPPASGAAR